MIIKKGEKQEKHSMKSQGLSHHTSIPPPLPPDRTPTVLAGP